MLQTAYCMNWASVFEWHQRFKEGMESVRDDEMCGRNKEVRTSELIGQIKNFMNKDRRVSIETISTQLDVSEGTVHTIIREELKMRKICAKFVQIRKKYVVMTAGRWSSWSIQIPLFLMLWWPAMKARSTVMSQRPRDKVPRGSMLALLDPRRPDRANPLTNFWWSLFFYSIGMIYVNWVPIRQTANKEYYFEVLRDFRQRLRLKRPTLFKSCTWHIHEDNTPLHNSIIVTDYLTKMGIKTAHHPPYSPDISPCDLWLFPKLKEKLRGCRNETIEMKEGVIKVFDLIP